MIVETSLLFKFFITFHALKTFISHFTFFRFVSYNQCSIAFFDVIFQKWFESFGQRPHHFLSLLAAARTYRMCAWDSQFLISTMSQSCSVLKNFLAFFSDCFIIKNLGWPLKFQSMHETISSKVTLSTTFTQSWLGVGAKGCASKSISNFACFALSKWLRK